MPCCPVGTDAYLRAAQTLCLHLYTMPTQSYNVTSCCKYQNRQRLRR